MTRARGSADELQAQAQSITIALRKFAQTKNPHFLILAIARLARQGRGIEVLYGLWCFVLHRRPQVAARTDFHLRVEIQDWLREPDVLRLADLPPVFRNAALSDVVPSDALFRPGTIAHGRGWTLLGEFGKSARMYHVGSERTTVIRFYDEIDGVRHIHSIHALDESQILISTGDAKKFLDLWHVDVAGARFVRRIMGMLGGFTAATQVGNDHYFGTDFSNRPNYLFRLRDRRKFFYPGVAYTRWTRRLKTLDNKFIVSMNCSTLDDSRATITLFDTQAENFIYESEL